MGLARGITKAVATAALLAAFPALAQFSDSYNFLKAVRDADATKTMEYLNKPGQPAINSRDGSTGETALHIVIKRHDATWLGVLLARGAQTEVRDGRGVTPLIEAAMLSDDAASALLLQYGAKPNASDAQGQTPLILAVQHRDLAMVRLLLTGGADAGIADTIAGKSARDYAAEDARGGPMLKLIDETKPKVGGAIAGPVRH